METRPLSGHGIVAIGVNANLASQLAYWAR